VRGHALTRARRGTQRTGAHAAVALLASSASTATGATVGHVALSIQARAAAIDQRGGTTRCTRAVGTNLRRAAGSAAGAAVPWVAGNVHAGAATQGSARVAGAAAAEAALPHRASPPADPAVRRIGGDVEACSRAIDSTLGAATLPIDAGVHGATGPSADPAVFGIADQIDTTALASGERSRAGSYTRAVQADLADSARPTALPAASCVAQGVDTGASTDRSAGGADTLPGNTSSTARASVAASSAVGRVRARIHALSAAGPGPSRAGAYARITGRSPATSYVAGSAVERIRGNVDTAQSTSDAGRGALLGADASLAERAGGWAEMTARSTVVRVIDERSAEAVTETRPLWTPAAPSHAGAAGPANHSACTTVVGVHAQERASVRAHGLSGSRAGAGTAYARLPLSTAEATSAAVVRVGSDVDAAVTAP
jgi:hypothetical protein